VLYRHSEVFRSLLMLADLALVAGAWLGAYALRFHTGFPAPLGVPDLAEYLTPLVAILPLFLFLHRSHGLYDPRRTGSLLQEVGLILRATAVAVVLLVAIGFFLRSYSYSRTVVALFAVLGASSTILLRGCLRLALRSLRRRGYNLRYVVVVGGGALAEEIIERIHGHPEAGLRVLGVLANTAPSLERKVGGVPVLGDYGGLKQAVAHRRVDQVFLALDRDESEALEKVLADLDDEMVSVKLVPDLLHVMTLRSSVDDLDGLPIINLRDSPMEGWAAVQKRAFDLAIAIPGLLLGWPLLAGIALLVRLTSRGPVFYSQERMGLDGRLFRMLKFRTMQMDAEGETGPVWAVRADERRTRIGALLRRLSLDELPQLWNVIPAT
jgi:exopolysaccharide biosynthesis polyprenyl glycosylphosphotransferase